MASYHLSVQIISRSAGQSSVAAAAYRAGERLKDERAGITHDYSRRRGVIYSGILVPPGAAPSLSDRSALWNEVERLEGRRDAQLAREINLALPHELDAGARRELLLNFVQEAFVSRGMVADVAVHEPVLEKGDHPHNHHAHILLTLRQATPSGLRRVKTREWNSDKLLTHWRALWATCQNGALARAGLSIRVDHRTLEAQRNEALERGDGRAAASLSRTPEVHIGRSEPRQSSKQSRPRTDRNAEILTANFNRARERLDMWRRAYAHRLGRPTKTGGALRADSARKIETAPELMALLLRIGKGITAWDMILRDRLARQHDFRQRHFANVLLRELGRAEGRVRSRQLDSPTVPQAAPAVLKPVTNLPGQDRVGQLPGH